MSVPGAHRAALVFLGVAAPVILGCFFFDAEWASWVFVLAAMGFPIALIALGASRNGTLHHAWIPLAVLAVTFEGSALAILYFATPGTRESNAQGYPLGVYFLLFGMWLMPLVVTSWGYAATFADSGIDDALVAQLEARRRRPDAG